MIIFIGYEKCDTEKKKNRKYIGQKAENTEQYFTDCISDRPNQAEVTQKKQ